MIKLKCFAVLLFVFSTLGFIHCQSSFKGLPYQSEKNFYPVKFVGYYAGEVLLLRVGYDTKTGFENSFILERFDSASLNYKGFIQPNLSFADAQSVVREDVLVWNRQLCILYSEFIKQERRYRLVCQPIQLNGKSGETQELLSVPASDFERGAKRFFLQLSENSKWLSALYLQEASRNSDAEISVARFDSLFELNGLTQAQIGFEPGKIEAIQSITDNDGNYHVLIKSKVDGLPVFSLFAFPVFGNEVLQYPMEIPGKPIESMRFTLDRSEKLFLSGVFRESFEQSGQISGVFFIVADRETGNIEHSGIHQFQTTLKELNAGDEKLMRDDLANLQCFGLFSAGNDQVVMLADSRGFRTECETDYRNGMEVCRDYFESGNLLAISFDKKGVPSWYRFLQHSSASIDDGGRFLGFQAFKGMAGSLGLIQNRLPQATAKLDADSWRKGVPLYGKLNSNGQYTESIADLTDLFPVYTGMNLCHAHHVLLLSAYDQNGRLIRIGDQ